jgi:hypothetical protein
MKNVQGIMTLGMLVLLAARAMAEDPGPVLNAVLFQKLDVDNDGNVSAAEFQRWLANQRPHQARLVKGIKPPADKDPAKKDAAKKEPARKPPAKMQHAIKTPAAQKGGKGILRHRGGRGVSFFSPSLPNEVVDVYGGTIYVVCDSDATPDPSDCDPDDDGIPNADEARVTMWARIYGPSSTLPGGASDPEQNNAQELQNLGSYQEHVTVAAYSKVEPLPQLTLFVWEKIEYLYEGEPVAGCPPVISSTTLTIYGHDAD